MEPKVDPPSLSLTIGLGYAFGLPVVFALLLFLPAGTIRWTEAWVVLSVLLSTSVAACVTIWIVNPVIFRARSRIQPGTETWDRWILLVMSIAAFAIMPVAGFDRRIEGTSLPTWAIVWGDVGLVAGTALMTWAQAVNAYFEPGVRLQTERHQRVIDTGPYVVLRHPGYVAAMKLFFGLALALGSVWALIPAFVASIVLVVRTAWEDRLLRDRLPGYAAYAARVRWRLIWGIW